MYIIHIKFVHSLVVLSIDIHRKLVYNRAIARDKRSQAKEKWRKRKMKETLYNIYDEAVTVEETEKGFKLVFENGKTVDTDNNYSAVIRKLQRMGYRF